MTSTYENPEDSAPPASPLPFHTDRQLGDDTDASLGDFAQRAYLEYALSVVKGRALPDDTDGQKPVQRRILYSMHRMGLGFAGTNSASGAKPVKSARVVGDVLGRFHPHGDQAAYDALVRMAQNFSQRYPLVDGQGNFGSRDGDGAAAMRYTEARLAKITTLLLDEIDQGTVPFVANYDGSTEEPARLPARLPFTLLNGASGIAVGMATEIPSHNLREVANACIALIKNPQLSEADLFSLVPGPDYPGGGQIISSATEIADTYRSGRGSLKVRARWKIEDLARGQWQLVVTELPPNVSSQRVLEEIEEITNPKVRTGKKALTSEQLQLKASVLAVLDGVRDESGKSDPVRLVFEPKSSRIEQPELIHALLAHTSLETTAPINLTVVGLDGKPAQKSLRQLFDEWIVFRRDIIVKRTRHSLDKVLERIHVLEGRLLVLLHIDEVIAIIRASDEPKSALIERFALSDRQAEDILEIRLRQLARLEAIRIQQELDALLKEQARLQEVLNSAAALNRLMLREIEQDAKTFADDRRTLIQPDKRVTTEVKVVDEPVTVVISEKGWVRARTGHGHLPESFTFKPGDGLYGTFACRSVDTLLIFGNTGRVYSVPVAALPSGRGDGQPVSTLVEVEPGSTISHFFAGPAGAKLLLSSSGGYGFVASVENMTTRLKAGKSFINCAEGESICRPGLVSSPAGDMVAASFVAAASTLGRLLTFELSELREMASGGRGLMLLDLEGKDTLAGAAPYARSIRIVGTGRGGKERDETLEIRSLNNAKANRGRKGKRADFGFKPHTVLRVE